MKYFITCLLGLVFLQAGQSQDILHTAQQKARLEQKFILLNFSGSDWCIPCIRMQKDLFDHADFKGMADSELVIIRADFPRKKKNQPAKDIMVQNEILAEKFNPTGSFPFTLLMNAEGKVLRVWDGKPDESASLFSASIRQVIYEQQKTK